MVDGNDDAYVSESGNWVGRTVRRGLIGRLERRVADLERDVTELRAQNLRLAEIADVVQELLIPMAQRDEAAMAAAIERFQREL